MTNQIAYKNNFETMSALIRIKKKLKKAIPLTICESELLSQYVSELEQKKTVQQ